ncbi:MAG: hypothetical protein ACOVS5_09215 [Oligoflexus sp.]|jgi:hypothetical protein
MLFPTYKNSLSLLIGVFLMSSPLRSEELWSAKKACQANFGLVNNCQANTHLSTIQVEAPTAAAELKLPRRVLAFFNASCSRVAGKSPLVKVRFGNNDTTLGFTSTPVLQVLETSAVTSVDLKATVEVDPKSSLAPDCRLEYFGSVSVLDANLAETLADTLAAQDSSLLNLRASILRLTETPATLPTLQALPVELTASSRRLTLACQQAIAQANRRINLPSEQRLPQDNTFIEFLIGPELKESTTSVDSRAICQNLETKVQGKNVTGLVLRYVSEILALKSLQERVALAIGDIEQCKETDPENCGLQDPEPLRTIDSIIAATKSERAKFAAFLKSEILRTSTEQENLRKNVQSELSQQLLQLESRQRGSSEIITQLANQLLEGV